MSCLCGRHLPAETSGLCSICQPRATNQQPVGPLARAIENTSAGDFALFLIALNKKREK